MKKHTINKWPFLSDDVTTCIWPARVGRVSQKQLMQYFGLMVDLNCFENNVCLNQKQNHALCFWLTSVMSQIYWHGKTTFMSGKTGLSWNVFCYKCAFTLPLLLLVYITFQETWCWQVKTFHNVAVCHCKIN